MANGVLVGEEAPGECFVNDHDFRRLGPIPCRERTSGPHRYAHRQKIFGTDVIGFNNRLLSLLKRRTPFDSKYDADSRSGEWKEACQAGGLHAGQRLDTRERFLIISDALRRSLRVFVVAGPE